MDWLLIALALLLLLCGALIGVAGAMLLRGKRCEDANESEDASVKPGGSLLDDETLMLVARATNDALWDLDLRTSELHWSEQLSHNFGYEQRDLHTKLDWWTERVHPDDREQAEQSLKEAIEAEREHWSAEYRFRRADGTYADIIDRGHTIYSKRGEAVRMIGAMIDVTSLRAAERALEEREAQFRTLLKNAPDVIARFDRNMRHLYVNEAAERLTGIPPSRFIGRTDRELGMPLDLVERWESAMREVFENEERREFEFDFESPNGKRHLMAIAVPERDDACEVTSILTIVRDITDRIKAEGQLRASEQRFATFMDNNPATAWIKNAHGQYVYVNKTLCAEFQVTEEEVLGRTDHELLPEYVADVLHTNDHTVLETRTPIETEEIISNPDGTDHTWLVFKFPIENIRGEALIGGLGLDITEKKHNEQALREYAEALEQSNRDLEQFAYVASHDLQEPLRMVSSYTDLLAKRYKGRLDEDADTFIGYAVDGAQRMQRLIQDLLTYSRVSSRGAEIEPTEADAALDTALANLRSSIEESGATIRREPLPRVRADAGQLAQVFQNLVSNAVKFREQTAPIIEISAEAGDAECVFSVRDNGIGIEPEYQDRVFVIFQRLGHREHYAGTGIGLALCKRIIERHGGRIWVESSSPEEGSIFRFSLPAVEGTSR